MTSEMARYRRDFAKAQRYTIHDLRAEIEANHLATAHRIAHTLKSLAALIDEDGLREIALKVEQRLRDRQAPEESDLQDMEAELDRVLSEIAASGVLNDSTIFVPLSRDATAALFNKLESALAESDASCAQLIPEIERIPETKVLVRQIELFAFADALVTLKILRDIFDV
ncbi:MAG: Hpt domain-containing protein [Defluviitaleaceae bacterium]|nr:Hpt domain-containing protein [Defluviitaleaceae bacterium]